MTEMWKFLWGFELYFFLLFLYFFTHFSIWNFIITRVCVLSNINCKFTSISLHMCSHVNCQICRNDQECHPKKKINHIFNFHLLMISKKDDEKAEWENCHDDGTNKHENHLKKIFVFEKKNQFGHRKERKEKFIKFQKLEINFIAFVTKTRLQRKVWVYFLYSIQQSLILCKNVPDDESLPCHWNSY